MDEYQITLTGQQLAFLEHALKIAPLPLLQTWPLLQHLAKSVEDKQSLSRDRIEARVNSSEDSVKVNRINSPIV